MLRAAIRGDLRLQTALVGDAAARAVAAGIRKATTLLKNALRAEILAAGLGPRLANAVRSEVWPARGGSLRAHGRVWSKAIYKRRSGLVDLFTTFEEGAQIRGSEFLALPLDDVGKSPVDLRRMARPDDFPKGTFGLRPTLRPGVFVLYWKDNPERFAFVLIRTVNVRKRLSLQRHHAAVEAQLQGLVAAEYERLVADAGLRLAA